MGSGDTISIRVVDAADLISPARQFVVPGPLVLPPDPTDTMLSFDRTTVTDLYDRIRFFYEDLPPVQEGVDPSGVDPRRVSLLRGRVFGVDLQPVGDVSVGIAGQPELGRTLTRTDGGFDLMVHGGGLLTVQYRSVGYLPVDRQIRVGWGEYAVAPDVVMTALDSEVTAVDLTDPVTVHVVRGSPVTDSDGTRRATLLIFPDTVAEIQTGVGGFEPVSVLNLRATEYTVGGGGELAMPAPLPPTSFYTYAVEYSADEATVPGGGKVLFSQPVVSYLENFLSLAVGSTVPAGSYDRETKTWSGVRNGRVVELLGVTGGLADLDLDGAGFVADAAALAAFGITDAEREKVADLYSVGQQLWRFSLDHFSPQDFNLPGAPDVAVPSDARAPQQARPTGGDEDKKDGNCLTGGSIIECESQVLGEVIGLTGTPLALHYRSDRVPGRTAAYELSIPLTGSAVPGSLSRVEVEVQVAGQSFAESFVPSPDLHHTFHWDGNDPYGRGLQGRIPYEARVGYTYPARYEQPPDGCDSCFGCSGSIDIAPHGRYAWISALSWASPRS